MVMTYPQQTLPQASMLLDTSGAYVNVEAFGAKGDNATDNYAAIMAAAAVLPNGNGTLLFHGGVFITSQELAFTGSVSLRGIGAFANSRNYGTTRPANALTVIRGAVGTGHAVVSYTDTMGVTIEDLAIDGAGSADYGLRLDRFTNGVVSRVRIRGAVTNALRVETTSVTSVNANGNTQYSAFRDLQLDSSGVAANGALGAMLWVGSTVASNICHCRFERVTITFGTGASDANPGMYLGWADNLTFADFYIFRNSGTGYGLLWDGTQNASGSISHEFYHLETLGGMHATTGAQGIIIGYDMSNGEGLPTMDAGSTVDVWPMYGTAVNNTFLARKLGIGAGGTAPNPATDWVHIVSNDSTGLRLQQSGFSPTFRTFVTGNGTTWQFTKPTGQTSTNNNARYVIATVGAIDSLNAYWNGVHFQGHTVTQSSVNKFPIFAFYARSTAAADPTDLEFNLIASNAGTLPCGVSIGGNGQAASYVRFGFGEGVISTEVFRVAQPGYTKHTGISADPTTPGAGAHWYNTTTRSHRFQTDAAIGMVGLLAKNTTPVTATNPSAASNLQSVTIPANVLNAVDKGLRIRGYGLYTTNAGQTPTITITVQLGGVTIATFTTTATQAGTTNGAWNFDLGLSTVTSGSTGTVEAHGELRALLTATAGQASMFLDTTTGASSAINLTAQQTLQVQVTLSSADAGNSVSQRRLTVEVLN